MISRLSPTNADAPFTLKLHRGDGMTLLAMNWKDANPPRDFVGFALEYKEPDGDRFWGIKNRINFPNPDGSVNKEAHFQPSLSDSKIPLGSLSRER